MSYEPTQAESVRAVGWLEDLQSLVDFLVEHPALVPVTEITVDLWPADAVEMARLGRELGTSEKFDLETWVGLRRKFGVHTIDVNAPNNLCERVQVGTETVRKTIVDGPLPEGARIVGTPDVAVIIETEEPVYERRCPESFLNVSDSTELVDGPVGESWERHMALQPDGEEMPF